jgi:hypothetical protein
MKRRTLLVKLLVVAVVSAAAIGGSYATFVPTTKAATEDEIGEAIARGVDWLAGQQKDDGSWGDSQQTAITCFALLKLEERAYELGYWSPFDSDYPYSENVVRGWQYIFGGTHVHKQAIDVQWHNGNPDNPDTNGNGYGVYFDTWGEHPTYTTGICLMALATNGRSSRPNDGGLDYDGDGNPDTFEEITQEAVDWLAFAQADSGWFEGGWDYDALDNVGDNADNSNSGYAVLGLAYGQDAGYTVPEWVENELNMWINHIQCNAAGDYHGGSGYGWTPCDDEVNALKTSNLILEMTFVDDAHSVQRFQDAWDYIERHWQDSNIHHELGPIGWGYNVYPAHYQAMYTLMRAFKNSAIKWIDTDGDGNRDDDWFNQMPPDSPPQDFATVLVAQQNADGSWPGCSYGNSILCTTWALLTLEKITADFGERLLAEAETHRVIQFNPKAALQSRIFADGLVPNSPEYDVQIRGIPYRAQLAEHLGTGKMRVYYAEAPDWDIVEEVAPDLEEQFLAEAEAHRVIQFNPNAALQSHIFADSFVPNSPEFDVQVRGILYRAQLAEHLGTGKMRVYYAEVPYWNNVEVVERP